MPICQWCGIDSKSEIVCDWCKRPLNAKNPNAPSAAKKGIDLLADNEEDLQAAVLPKVLAAGAVVCLAVLATVVFAVSNNGKPPPAPAQDVVAPAPSHSEMVAVKQPISPLQASFAPPPPRIFLPDAASAAFRPIISGTNIAAPRASVQLDHQADEVKFGLSAAKLSAFRQPNGKLIVVGKIGIFNGSADNIVDFNLSLVVEAKKYKLIPFSGTFEQREILTDRVVLSKEKASIPVYAENFKGKVGQVAGTVKMVVNIDSTDKPFHSEFQISAPQKHANPTDRG